MKTDEAKTAAFIALLLAAALGCGSGGGQPAGGRGNAGSTGEGGSGGNDDGNDAGAGGGCAATHSLGAACEPCVRGAVSAAKCGDQTLFSARRTIDESSGDPIAEGFGPDTLPTAAQRDAAYALIERLETLLPGSARNAPNTALAGPGSDDANFPNGLLVLGAGPLDLFLGVNLAPRADSALDAYEAAVVADGLPAGSSDATFAAYISSHATEPEGVVGLVDNILTCAMNAALADPRCHDCFQVATAYACDAGTR